MSKHLMKIAVSAMALIAALGIASIPNRNVSADQDTAITPM